MIVHPLENPFWHALAGPQRGHSLGGGLARRYRPGLAPQAALADPATAGLTELARLVEPDENIDLVWSERQLLPPQRKRIVDVELQQMGIGKSPRNLAAVRESTFVELCDTDVPEMLELARAARPGPLLEGAPALGRFIGIRRGNRRVAMAGERANVEGSARSAECVRCTSTAVAALQEPWCRNWLHTG